MPLLREHRDEVLLKQLHDSFVQYKLIVAWLAHIFKYLDRYYIPRVQLPSLRDTGVLCFLDVVYSSDTCRVGRDFVLQLVAREREGNLIDRSLVKNFLDPYLEAGLTSVQHYELDFEADLLDEAASFYRRKGSEWVVQESCSSYMIKAEQCLRLEEERAESYLPSRTRVKLIKHMDHELLSQHHMTLLHKENTGVAALFRDDKMGDIARMYRLFQRIPKGLDPIANMFSKHVEHEGRQLIKQVAEAMDRRKERNTGKPSKNRGDCVEQAYVQSVISLHEKYAHYVASCFRNSTLFHRAFEGALMATLNEQVAGSSWAEVMANFCDSLLKKGGAEQLSDAEVEQTLQHVVKLVAYVWDKDMFTEFLCKRLARRLLHDRSALADRERSLVMQLKLQCGFTQLTSKMEGMLTDMQLAREQQQGFDRWSPTRTPQLGVDLSVAVLTTGYWPTYQSQDLALPAELVEAVAAFRQYYLGHNPNRKLTWMYSLGTCSLVANFDKHPIELILSTLQAATLMVFNDNEELSFSEVCERLNLPEEDTTRMLHSLACTKYKILTKHPAGRTVAATDNFSFNSSFTDRLRRIRIPLPHVDEKRRVLEKVHRDRGYAVDAAIVRTMKSRRTLQQQVLCMEVMTQLSRMFKPDLELIKKRIEYLIGREHIERDKDHPHVINYLA